MPLHRLVSLTVDGGFDVIIDAVVTKVRTLNIALEGEAHLRVKESDSALYRKWRNDKQGTNLMKTLSATIGNDIWILEGCSIKTISDSGTDIVITFDMPKKNGRYIHSRLE